MSLLHTDSGTTCAESCLPLAGSVSLSTATAAATADGQIGVVVVRACGAQHENRKISEWKKIELTHLKEKTNTMTPPQLFVVV